MKDEHIKFLEKVAIILAISYTVMALLYLLSDH